MRASVRWIVVATAFWIGVPAPSTAQLAGTQEAMLVAPGGARSDMFGVTVALTDDGLRAFIGASHGNVTGSSGGHAYVSQFSDWIDVGPRSHAHSGGHRAGRRVRCVHQHHA